MNDGSFAILIVGAGKGRLADEPLPEFLEAERHQGVDQGYTVRVRLAGWFKNHGQGDVAGYKIGDTTKSM